MDEKMRSYRVSASVWIYPGMAGWHFVTIPKDLSATITKRFAKWKKGWGSLPVRVTVGEVSWDTSIFPDRKAGAYLLPLKATVRKKTKIARGDKINLLLKIRV